MFHSIYSKLFLLFSKLTCHPIVNTLNKIQKLFSNIYYYKVNSVLIKYFTLRKDMNLHPAITCASIFVSCEYFIDES